jgi:hypothetical protein
MNEWRATVSDVLSNTVTREVLDALLAQRDGAIKAIADTSTRNSIIAGTAGAVLGLVGGIIVAGLLP